MLRTRWFCLIAVCVATAGVRGDPAPARQSHRRPHHAAARTSRALGAIFFLYRRTSDPLRFAGRAPALGWFIPACAVTTAIPYFGVFSPVGVILVLGIYFTGLGKSRRSRSPCSRCARACRRSSEHS